MDIFDMYRIAKTTHNKTRPKQIAYNLYTTYARFVQVINTTVQ